MAFNTTADIRRLLNIESGNDLLTDTEITAFLDEANLELYRIIKRKYERDCLIVRTTNTGATKVTYSTSLKPLDSVFRVLVNDVLQTVTTDYTVDLDLGEITFTENTVAPGDSVVILSVPTVYKTAELYIATSNILISTSALGVNALDNPVLAQFEKKRDSILKVITGRLIMAQWS